MTLNSVDLPQPDGPITARNSPGATSNEMWSTAVTTPSASRMLHDVVDDEQRRGCGRARNRIEPRRGRHQAFLSAFETAAVMAGV
jgi:hypothetical protein